MAFKYVNAALAACRVFRGNDRTLLVVLCHRASDGDNSKIAKGQRKKLPAGWSFPSLAQLRQDTAMSQDVLCDALNALKAEGVLRIRNRKRTSNWFFIDIERLKELADPANVRFPENLPKEKNGNLRTFRDNTGDEWTISGDEIQPTRRSFTTDKDVLLRLTTAPHERSFTTGKGHSFTTDKERSFSTGEPSLDSLTANCEQSPDGNSKENTQAEAAAPLAHAAAAAVALPDDESDEPTLEDYFDATDNEDPLPPRSKDSQLPGAAAAAHINSENNSPEFVSMTQTAERLAKKFHDYSGEAGGATDDWRKWIPQFQQLLTSNANNVVLIEGVITWVFTSNHPDALWWLARMHSPVFLQKHFDKIYRQMKISKRTPAERSSSSRPRSSFHDDGEVGKKILKSF